MAWLIYSAIQSLDGYVADRDGSFGWAEPDEEVHSFLNDLERQVGTYLYGRRLYEVMTAWESMPLADQPAHIRDFAEMWRSAQKVVYSRTLESPSTARIRLERDFDPEAVRQMKRAADRHLIVGGPGLAAEAFRARLVDECHLFLVPVAVAAGRPRCRPTSVSISSSWTNDASIAASSTSATGSGPDHQAQARHSPTRSSR
jgi:dihydrofolate reductase